MIVLLKELNPAGGASRQHGGVQGQHALVRGIKGKAVLELDASEGHCPALRFNHLVPRLFQDKVVPVHKLQMQKRHPDVIHRSCAPPHRRPAGVDELSAVHAAAVVCPGEALQTLPSRPRRQIRAKIIVQAVNPKAGTPLPNPQPRNSQRLPYLQLLQHAPPKPLFQQQPR